MAWRHGTWTVEHGLPFGVSERVALGEEVVAGDVLASGSIFGAAATFRTARDLRVSPKKLASLLRVRPGDEVRRGAILARTEGRFSRVASAALDGRLLHVTSDGDLVIAPVLGGWIVRCTLDGEVVRSDATTVTVRGDAWCLPGLAAYGPDAFGELALAVDAPMDDLSPGRIDVRLRGKILIGGARMAAEAITRAHACGVAAVIAGAAPAGGLRVVYGDDVTADGLATRDDVPTVLCLVGFGTATLPTEIFAPLIQLAGARAAVHTASARLFAFAPATLFESAEAPAIALADDHSGVRPLASPGELGGSMRFPSEVESEALLTESGPVPLQNVLAFDTRR